MFISVAPRHLCVCLKRNAYDPAAQRISKLMLPVSYPCVLVHPVVSEDVGGAMQEVLVPFVLYAVVIHSGT